MKIKALITHTFRELFAKKILFVLLGISTLIILVVLFGVSMASTSAGIVVTLFGEPIGQPIPQSMYNELVMKLQVVLANGIYSGLVIFGVFATAGVIPDMLEKGTVDLYLSKPISRWELLIGKYLGASFVMFANALYFIGSLWLITGIKLGVWNIHFLLSALTLTVIFMCLYAIVVFFGVLSRSNGISILAAFTYLFVIAPLLNTREQTLYLISSNETYRKFIDALYYILPQLSGIQENLMKQISGEGLMWRPILQSSLCALAFFLGSIELLRRKDF